MFITYFLERPHKGLFFLRINTYMKDKKAAKKIIRIAKCCPEYYTEADVTYAKIIKKNIKDQQNSSK